MPWLPSDADSTMRACRPRSRRRSVGTAWSPFAHFPHGRPRGVGGAWRRCQRLSAIKSAQVVFCEASKPIKMSQRAGSGVAGASRRRRRKRRSRPRHSGLPQLASWRTGAALCDFPALHSSPRSLAPRFRPLSAAGSATPPGLSLVWFHEPRRAPADTRSEPEHLRRCKWRRRCGPGSAWLRRPATCSWLTASAMASARPLQAPAREPVPPADPTSHAGQRWSPKSVTTAATARLPAITFTSACCGARRAYAVCCHW